MRPRCGRRLCERRDRGRRAVGPARAPRRLASSPIRPSTSRWPSDARASGSRNVATRDGTAAAPCGRAWAAASCSVQAASGLIGSGSAIGYENGRSDRLSRTHRPVAQRQRWLAWRPLDGSQHGLLARRNLDRFRRSERHIAAAGGCRQRGGCSRPAAMVRMGCIPSASSKEQCPVAAIA